MTKAAVYCRVSTDNQEREGSSLTTQAEYCLKYCQDKGYEVAYRFSETYSGLTLKRPEMEKLRDVIQLELIDVVVAYSLDRVSRDPVDGVILMQELERHDVALETVTEDVDSSEIGRLISYIRGFASKLEAEKIKERTGRGKAHLVKKGILPTGTGAGLYGYSWNKETKKREPVELEVQVVTRIFEMIAGGMSRFKVAEALNKQGIPGKDGGKWHPLTINRIVTNEAYIGRTFYYQTKGSRKTELIKQDRKNWTELKDVTPAIIEKSLFDKVQAQLTKQKESRQSVKSRNYLLRGFAYCEHCGSPLIGSCLSKKYFYYRCRGTTPTSTRKAICSARYIPVAEIEGKVWDAVKDVLSKRERILSEIKKEIQAAKAGTNTTSIDKEIKVIERRLKDYPAQEKRLVSALKLGKIDENLLLDEINQINEARKADTEQIEQLKQSKANLAGLELAEAKLKEFYDSIGVNIENATPEQKRLAFEALALHVTASLDSYNIAVSIPVEATLLQSPDDKNTFSSTEQTSALPRERSCRSRRV